MLNSFSDITVFPDSSTLAEQQMFVQTYKVWITNMAERMNETLETLLDLLQYVSKADL